ncbi:type III polyketide synthase [Anaeromyxobacter diazotrophicus]|uniref:Stilbene synthase n=1 Tax=Anaeromyxobacter diazotrophicus TaxID=2590199 RepID=A0A7I9VQ55_9BACT|nr:3-oxoacyl-[acyl-carrier-protein] synthase III C-terminal domain-containing protein [Anaeromyxobacter diazotrophicus]GEJ58491.1 stilbene synthase [Anaeromyxobacter diazotrophicus]
MHHDAAPRLTAVGRALPRHHLDQEELIQALRGLWAEKHFNVERLEDLHRAVQVSGRYLALPLEAYASLDSFRKCNDAFVEVAQELGAEAIQQALARAGLRPRDVDHVFFVTVTGVATPSIDARLVNRLGLKPSVKRTPIFGLGCLAGAAGTARAADYLRAFPGEVALLLSVELCSLTLQRQDLSVANIIASGLFGDGAAALALTGGDRGAAGPRVLATRSVFYPDTERVMGWDVVDTGFKLVLSAGAPDVIREHLGGDVDAFLAEHHLTRRDVRHWVAHTGGPKILQAMETSLALPEGALARSWRSLRDIGNLSSASVLFVLGDLLESGEARPGDLGVMAAMGPGFCAELVLLRW